MQVHLHMCSSKLGSASGVWWGEIAKIGKEVYSVPQSHKCTVTAQELNVLKGEGAYEVPFRAQVLYQCAIQNSVPTIPRQSRGDWTESPGGPLSAEPVILPREESLSAESSGALLLRHSSGSSLRTRVQDGQGRQGVGQTE